MEAPPVDYGALMLYNTGDPQKWTERNPILDHRYVAPYLRHLEDFPLPLAATSALHIRVICVCFVDRIICPIFLIPHISDIIQYLSFSV